jgi:hypothetical protein
MSATGKSRIRMEKARKESQLESNPAAAEDFGDSRSERSTNLSDVARL